MRSGTKTLNGRGRAWSDIELLNGRWQNMNVVILECMGHRSTYESAIWQLVLPKYTKAHILVFLITWLGAWLATNGMMMPGFGMPAVLSLAGLLLLCITLLLPRERLGQGVTSLLTLGYTLVLFGITLRTITLSTDPPFGSVIDWVNYVVLIWVMTLSLFRGAASLVLLLVGAFSVLDDCFDWAVLPRRQILLTVVIALICLFIFGYLGYAGVGLWVLSYVWSMWILNIFDRFFST